MKKVLLILMIGMFSYAKPITLPDNFKANFTQKITNPKNKTINYGGKIQFSNKTKLKWIYTKPTKKEVCTNGKELTVVDHDLEQVSNYLLINKGFNFTKIVKNAKFYKKNIYVAKNENTSYTIQLNNSKLHSIAYFDELDNKVQIVFKNVKYGKGDLDKKSMICKVPKDYDMIRG